MQKIIKMLKKMNKIALKNGDVPVSCVILKNNKIVSKSYNKKVKNHNPFDHAEIISIKKACKKLKTENLGDCELIVTLKPCKMCEEVINQSRIKKVHYFMEQEKNVNNTIKYIKINEESTYFREELVNFFVNKR